MLQIIIFEYFETFTAATVCLTGLDGDAGFAGDDVRAGLGWRGWTEAFLGVSEDSVNALLSWSFVGDEFLVDRLKGADIF